jgi:hypothetical protein
LNKKVAEVKDGDEQTDEVAESGGIMSKITEFDPLADFVDMEKTQENEFESWEGKKVKIFAMFKKITDG